jgi:hypothetical protein
VRPQTEKYFLSQEHERHSPNCKLLTAPLSSTNIPLAATMSCLSPLKWNNGIESQQQTFVNHVEKIIVGMMTTRSLWFAFADPLSAKPQITLLHLNKVTQVLFNLLTIQINSLGC